MEKIFEKIEDLGGKGGVFALTSQTTYCMEWLKRGEALIPSLDDMAQIIGSKAPVIDGRKDPENATSSLLKILGNNAGGFVITGQEKNGAFTGYTVTVGRSQREAEVALSVLEKSAEVTLLAKKIGAPCHINALERKLMRMVYLKKYSRPKAFVGSNPIAGDGSREFALRQQLADYGRKLVSCGLVQGTWGNLSVRLDDESMLVTPSGIDYEALSAGDMVKVNIRTLEYEGQLKPTSEKGLHAKVYQDRPEIGGVIHTHSKYCSVYAAARKDLPIPADTASAQAVATSAGKSACEASGIATDKSDFKSAGGFLNPVCLAKYALPGTKALIKNTAAALGANYGGIMSNHGMIACGDTLPAAFENCVRLEELAKANLLK